MKKQKVDGVLLDKTKESGPLWLKDYVKIGGYEGLKKALTEMKPADVVAEIQKAGLRGRGGAGFPTWKKWEQVAKSNQTTKYLCANAGEHEPGTFKDRHLIQKNPHLLIEGALIAAYAVGAREAYLYVNGEFHDEIEIVKKAMAEAKAKGYWGNDILRAGVNIELKLTPGSGSYVAGEETGMLEVIEGRPAKPRQKPPYYPSYMGLYNKPTVVNNAETLANVPLIIRNGADWYHGIGTEQAFGTVLFSLSGDVKQPGVYELPLGTTLRTLIEKHGLGVKGGESIKAVLPGGPSNGFVTEENLDVQLDFESLKAIGSGLGSGGVIVYNDQTCMVRTMLEFELFFAKESCGQCPPCQLGTQNLATILQRLEDGRGSWDDLAYLAHLCEIVKGRGYCYLVTGAAILLESSLKHFRYEYELHMQEKAARIPSETTLSMPIIYLDHVGATPLLKESFEAMVPYLKEKFGNPQARYDLGQASRQAVEGGRGQVASLIGAEEKEIIFTASGSESNNLAIKGVVQSLAGRGRSGGHLITTRIEHHSVANAIKTLETRGYEATYLPVDSAGRVSPETVAAAIRPDTIFVSVMHANNEIGTIQPIEAIGRITQERDIVFHTDAVATAGVIPVDVNQLGVDLLSLSGQQLYGPKGIGALFVRKGTRLAPLIEGGIQEGGKRAGTENVAGIAGMGVAAEIAQREIGPRWKRMQQLRDRLVTGLEERIDRLQITGHRTERLPNIVSFCLEYVEGEAIVMLLARHGIYAAAGSNCSSPELRASSVVLALGIPHQIAQGAVLMSLGKGTTEAETDRVLEVFPTLVRKLRAMSPVYEEVVKGPSGR